VGCLLKRCAALTALVSLWLCAASLAAAASAPARMTYITGLGTAHPQVWIAAVNGSGAVALGPASSAMLSPDGSAVASVSIAKTEKTLSLYPAAGGTPTVVQKSVQVMQLLDWSADSKLILVSIGPQLDVVNAATGQALTIATGVIEGASFSPGTADAVVYARAAPNSTTVNIYTTSSIGIGTRQLTRDGRSELPLWGPNGIVYSHEYPRAKNPYPELQLWFMKANGSGAHRLTHISVSSSVEGLTPIAFSANGQHLLANFVGPQDHTEAYAVDLTKPGGAPRNLTSQDNGYIGDAISADGRTILLTKGVADNLAPLSIQTITWSGGKPTTVVKLGAYASWNL